MEALGALEKTPWIAPGGSAEDWLAGQDALAEVVCLKGSCLSPAPIPSRGAVFLRRSSEQAYEGGERRVTPCVGIQVGLEQAARGLSKIPRPGREPR